MRRFALLTAVWITCIAAPPAAASPCSDDAVHLFILSGQSNMQGLDPAVSFTPAVEAAFGADRVVVVKDAQGGQPINRWVRGWTAADGTAPEKTGDLYDRLLNKVHTAVAGKTIDTVTFVWMQGERDARERHGDVYAASLQRLVDQVSVDLGRDDVNCVIGRLSDFDMANARYGHWTRVRAAQVEFAESYPRGAWVDTDDLNDGLNRAGREIRNDLHLSVEGYRTLGERFATEAIALVRNDDRAPRPNIVVILADDLGYGDVGCYNPSSNIPTPNLDRMAAEGMQFMDAHSPATVCSPTRLSVLTGRHSFRFDGGGRVFVGIGGPCTIPQERLTLPAMLRSRGYATAAVGKWHCGLSFSDANGDIIDNKAYPDVKGLARVELVDFTRRIAGGPVDRGFDSFFGTACCPTTDTLYSYIVDDRIPNPPTKRKDPDALPGHFYALDCRAGLQSDDFDLEQVDLVFLEKSQAFIRRHVAEKPGQPFFLYHAMQAVHLPSFPAPRFQGKTSAGPHGDFIFELDYVVGALMETLRELGIEDDTLVLFSSDNGPETPTVWHMRNEYGHDGSRPWRGVKREVWEGGHRVPLIARWPGHVPAGVQSSQLISLVDLMATLAALAGAELPNDAAEDSFDFSPVLLGEDDGTPVRTYMMQASWQGLSIRHGRWKYMEKPYERGERGRWVQSFILPDLAEGSTGQLYDLETDPGETHNLFFENPEMTEKLRDELQRNKRVGRSTPSRGED